MPRPTPASAPLSPAEFAGLLAPFGVPDGAHVAVAVSGGADSLALTLLLAEWGRARGVRVSALTVDHGLRPGSAAEARQVAAWLAAAGISHHVLRWHGGVTCTTAVQARARDARYRMMAAWCKANGAARLFAAHHLGDQAETFLMRLKRSSTLFGLAAMTPQCERFGVTLCRPLLGVAKARLEATLGARGQVWVDDPSNANPAFERVRTRALIAGLEAEGIDAARLARAADAARRVTDILDRAVDAFLREAVCARPGGFYIDAAAFCALPVPLRERALARLLHDVGGGGFAPGPAKTARLAAWLARPHAARGSARTLGGCVARPAGGRISVTREGPRKRAAKDKKSLFFAAAPLPRAGKSLTSQATGGA